MATTNIYGLSNYVTHGNLIAGAAAEGEGALTDWHGRGSLSGADIAMIVSDIIPKEWLPAPKEAPTQLGRALQQVAGYHHVVKPVRHSRSPEVRATETWLARYILVTNPVATAVVAGKAYGTIVIVATLVGDDHASSLELDLEWSEDPAVFAARQQLATQLRAAYNALLDAQVHTASDITHWLGYTLRKHLQSIRYGRSYYLPRETREQAEALVNAFRSNGWGHNWMYPALPVATSGQLALGLALGLALDVSELAEDTELDRRAAREAGRFDIGERGLASKRLKLDDIRARVNFYADRLGESRAEVDGPIKDLEVVFEEIEQGLRARAELAS